MAEAGGVGVVALQLSSFLPKRRSCAPASSHALLQRLHWPQWGWTVQVGIRNTRGMDVC